MERYKYTVTNLKDLQSGSATARSFCEQLHRRSFAVIKLPVEALADITAVRNSASTFFALPADSKRSAVGDFRQVGGTYAGYRDLAGSARQSDCDAEFLEVHVDRAGAAVPAPPEPPALAAAAAALHARLLAVARALLGLLADHIKAPAGALLWAWEADAEYDEEAGEEWLVLLPKKWNKHLQYGWRFDACELRAQGAQGARRAAERPVT